MESCPLCSGLVSWKSPVIQGCGCPYEVWFGQRSQVVRNPGLPCPPMFLEARWLGQPSREVAESEDFPFSVFLPKTFSLGRSETASPRPVRGYLHPYGCTLCQPYALSCPVSGVQAHPVPTLVPAWLWMTPGQGASCCPPQCSQWREVWVPCLWPSSSRTPPQGPQCHLPGPRTLTPCVPVPETEEQGDHLQQNESLVPQTLVWPLSMM